MAIKYYTDTIMTGLSTDTKPTNVPNFSVFIETDTQKIWVLDTTWKLTGGGAPTAAEYLVGAAHADLSAEIVVSKTKGNILTATGSALANLAVGTNGQVLTADSAQTNGIKWGAGVEWSKLAEVTLGAAASSISTGTITAKRMLMIRWFYPGLSAAAILQLRFNNDSGLNYDSIVDDDGTPQVVTNRAQFEMNENTMASAGGSGVAWVYNVAGQNKLVHFLHADIESRIARGGGRYEVAAGQITDVMLRTAGGQNFNANTRLAVWGGE